MKIVLVFLALLIGSPVYGDITCKGVSSGLNRKITVIVDTHANKAHVFLPDETIGEVYETTSSYDGHMTGLVTARGFSLKYESIYGCYRNVVIVTNVRYSSGVRYIDTFNIPFCSGGTTPDDLCQRK